MSACREVGLTQDGEVPDGEALEEEDDDYLPLLDPLFKPGAGRGGGVTGIPVVKQKKPDMMKTGVASAKELAVYETAYVLPHMRESCKSLFGVL